VTRDAPSRAAFRLFRPIQTRWADNDVYAHVNNVVYYGFFDTIVNGWLIEAGHLEVGRSEIVGLVVETQCQYFAPVAFPDRLEGGLRVDRVGRSSVTYAIGIFREDGETAVAAGRFVHVYVDAETRRPVPLPRSLRDDVTALSFTP